MAGVVLANLGKRGREKSSAEQWRELARTVPGTLLRVATSESEAVLSRLASSCRGLRSRPRAADPRQDCRTIRRRANGYHRRVVRRLATLLALHDGAGRVFALSATRLGLVTGRGGDAEAQALWRAWDGHRADVAGHAGGVQQRLRSAVAYLGAAVAVVYVNSGAGTPVRVAWVLEARRLMLQAAREFTAARDAVLRMRHAVFLEFFDAWMILSRHDELSCA